MTADRSSTNGRLLRRNEKKSQAGNKYMPAHDMIHHELNGEICLLNTMIPYPTPKTIL